MPWHPNVLHFIITSHFHLADVDVMATQPLTYLTDAGTLPRAELLQQKLTEVRARA